MKGYYNYEMADYIKNYTKLKEEKIIAELLQATYILKMPLKKFFHIILMLIIALFRRPKSYIKSIHNLLHNNINLLQTLDDAFFSKIRYKTITGKLLVSQKKLQTILKE